MRVMATYEGPSSVKVNEAAVTFCMIQEEFSGPEIVDDDELFPHRRLLYEKPCFPDIVSGDWVGVSGNMGVDTKYGLVLRVEYDERPGWEDAAEEYYIHIVEDNQDIKYCPTELVSHAPMTALNKINQKILEIKLRKDMYEITNRLIASYTNSSIVWN